MNWFATHRIIQARQSHPPEVLEVLALDLGVDHPGRGRYALYTQSQWEAEAVPEWTMDSDDRVWYQDQAPPENATVTAESLLG